MAKRKRFTKEQLTRFSEYTETAQAANREAIRSSGSDDELQSLILAHRDLEDQAAAITRNLAVDDAGPRARTAAAPKKGGKGKGSRKSNKSKSEVDTLGENPPAE